MSITDIIYKIKRNTGIDKVTLLYLYIIIGVGISSFCLGRLSIIGDLYKNGNLTAGIIREENILKNDEIINNENLSATSIQSNEKRYVASKNGKMYYSLGCSGAKRIKPENEIWFNSKEDAEKSGFTLSAMCK